MDWRERSRLLGQIPVSCGGRSSHGAQACLQKFPYQLLRQSQALQLFLPFLYPGQTQGQEDQEASPLYEELGGIWKLSELEELGSCKKDMRLVQLFR